ncbi:RNA polymerase sigma factor [Halobacillus litoralis]|uniref:RNA polymerase sigma factor n=1 Tax=Halobacillus litoralis TaxID=45668 RepID=UPI0021F53F46|nr:RNA polymerase sigma factor [Halobacillus litoralis]
MYKRHYQRVYYTALKVIKDPCSAEDILQETFIKAYNKLDGVREEEKAGSWLCTIAHRKAIDLLRKEKKAILVSLEHLPPAKAKKDGSGSDVERLCEYRHMEEDIKRRVSTLSPKLRVVFQLSYDKNMVEKEIAHELRISQAAVKSRLHRARRVMKKNMEKEIKHFSTA